jgi:hypothetical protein
MKFRYELTLMTFIAFVLAMPSYSPAETILRAKGYSKVPWDPASGEVLSPPFWLKLDVDQPNKKFVVPSFVANKANAMKIEFVYKNEAQRYQDIERIGCGIGSNKPKHVIPLNISIYSIDNMKTPVMEKHGETTVCESFGDSDNTVMIGLLSNIDTGKHYSILVETIEKHPEFKTENIDVYFELSYFGHSD